MLCNSVVSHEGFEISRYNSINFTVTPDFVRVVSVQLELEHHPNWFVKCPLNPHYLDYCQQHYLMLWDSESGSFSDYQSQEIISGDNYDVTYSIHTS